ncbi:3-hydroxy-3-isohexenylglutaryl-CoA/hydroxy-methylglutaryl-CoA lyase [bacterium HR19]|nr:3-hydroxy-3-isohexenylglutaryl-CoA/hydroxy-methylglutaryl-CoA lyase [bacterium HR19]
MEQEKQIKIVEVSPRDGLQNEKEILPPEKKKELIESLCETGVDEIEVGSFVSPKAVPQMKDTDNLLLMINKKNGVKFSVLIPNMKGFERMMNIPESKRPEKIAVFTAASDTFNLKNINATVEDSFKIIKPVIEEAKKLKFEVRAYISTAFWCPFEGKVKPEKVIYVAEKLFELGVDEVSVGDTIGRASPKDVSELLSLLLKKISRDKIALHFHNTYGMAVLNSFISFRDFGIRTFDSSAGGLGGCPFAPGASGNVATEDLIFMFENSGVKTGVDFKKVMSAVLKLEIPLRSSLSKIQKIIE